MKKGVHGLKVLLFSILVLVCLATNSSIVFGEDGPEVPTKGVITLYDEKTTDSSQTKPLEPSNPNPTASEKSALDNLIKPKGKLPSTGELIRYGFVTVGFLLAIIVSLYLAKRMKTDEGSDE